MPRGPIRRSQLIAPFGVGALVVGRDGVSLISGGLDHWFEREDKSGGVDIEEFKVNEWRREKLLDVDHFRLPPDFRVSRLGQNVQNAWLTQPFLHFPQWHFCSSCSRLYRRPLTERGRILCPDCLAARRRRPLFQVQFVAMCDRGHIQDFLWREWVHRSEEPSCQGVMRLIATGGATLAAQRVECECGMQRTLASITNANTDGTTFLSNNLLGDDVGGGNQPYLCRGLRPWLGEEEASGCGGHLRGSLRSASNLHFAAVGSSIYLPRGSDLVPATLVSMLEEPPLSTFISVFSGTGNEVEPEPLRSMYSQLLEPYSDDQVRAALQVVRSGELEGTEVDKDLVAGDDRETAFRRAEFNILCSPRGDDELLISEAKLNAYDEDIGVCFSKIMLVSKLRETRAFAGFTRIFPENGDSFEDRKKLLWRNHPQGKYDWLPAYIVYGEGIFIELHEDRLKRWEQRDDVVTRVKRLAEQYQRVQQTRRLRDRPIEPRFLLLHTLSHLVMNRLTFECGYSSAALRERLYNSSDPDYPMASILIYTAAGDAEGTMGGLVRMGKPGNLEPVIRRALESASWCSADPVCMETAALGGQGPDSCNLAACHNCALVPETACEEFNRFLDRGVVIGEPDNGGLGYFTL